MCFTDRVVRRPTYWLARVPSVKPLDERRECGQCMRKEIAANTRTLRDRISHLVPTLRAQRLLEILEKLGRTVEEAHHGGWGTRRRDGARRLTADGKRLD